MLRKRFGHGMATVGLLLVTWLLLAGGVEAGLLQDDFADNFLNPNLWEVELIGSGPGVLETNGRLEVTFPASASGDFLMANVRLNYELLGDFEVQVDFNLLEWPAANGLNVSLTTGLNFMLSRYSYTFFDKEGYLLNVRGQLISVPATETSGKLRLKRTGTTLTAYYWRDNAWQSLGSFTHSDFAAPTHVSLAVDAGQPSRFSGQQVRIAFDNFRLGEPNLSNPARNLEALLLLLE